MTIDPSTPGESADLLTLLYALEWEEWPDERTRSRVLRWLRARNADVKDRIARRYEAGRQQGVRLEKERQRSGRAG